MFKDEETKQKQENLQNSIRTITKLWPKMKNELGIFREEIADEFFKKNPHRMQLFERSERSGESGEGALDRKLLKHSTAVINCMETIVDFVNGNEESKPMYFILGRRHKHFAVSEKMFLEMKDAICHVMEKRFTKKDSRSWETVLEYIYINYVFSGMNMIEVFH